MALVLPYPPGRAHQGAWFDTGNPRASEEQEPDAAGLWWSAEIPIGIGVADGAVTIYDREGRGQLREVEELRRRLTELEGR